MFQNQCLSCHGGSAFTASAAGVLRDVGTLKTTSGTRSGAALTGIDIPTLRDVWATAPYLHDGSAATVEDELRALTGVVGVHADQRTGQVEVTFRADLLPPETVRKAIAAAGESLPSTQPESRHELN